MALEFVENTRISRTGIKNIALGTADFDNEPNTDILIPITDSSSNPIIQVYSNDGSGNFSQNTSISLTDDAYADVVATVDFDNDGDIDILITGVDDAFNPIIQIYSNDGSGNLSPNNSIALTDVGYFTEIATVDFDNDGDTDILILGEDSSFNPIIQVYSNDGSGNLNLNNSIALTDYNYPNVVATADFDNNGETDILIEGTVSAGITSQLYSNDGSGNFSENTSISLTDVAYVSEVRTADFDNDGDTDILITGEDSLFNSITQIYSNDGSGNFSQNTSISLTNDVYADVVATVDFDNDGDTDILTTGFDDEFNQIIQVYSNDGSGDFSQNTSISFADDVYADVVGTGDFDNDGDTDILITSFDDEFNRIIQVYSKDDNGNFSQNTSISFTDDVYADVVGTADFDNDGNIDILTTGFDDEFNSIIQIYSNDGSGNFSQSTSIPLTDVGYYSEVVISDFDKDGNTDILIQGEDSSFNPIIQVYSNDGSGNFSQNTSISITDIGYNSEVVTADFDNDGDTDILFTPSNSSFDSISQVYSNDGNGDLAPNTSISLAGVDADVVATADFDNDGDTDILTTGVDDEFNPIAQLYSNDGSGNFSLENSISFTGVYAEVVGTADFDNDGDTDILTTGFDDEFNPINQVYSNDGSGNFSLENSISFTGFYEDVVGTVDFDNDGDTDILTTGFNDEFNPISEVYSNDGSGDFSQNTSIFFTGVYGEVLGTADFDNEGDTEIFTTEFDDEFNSLLPGSDSLFNPTIEIYSNDGSGNFTQNTSSFIDGVDANVVGTADFDNDGDIDILTTGVDDAFNPIIQIYSNDGSGDFTQNTSISLTDFAYVSEVATVDFDNDGDTDILITGFDNEFNPIAQVYNNDGSGEFTQNTSISLTDVAYVSEVTTVDFDNDGDTDILITGSDSSFDSIIQLYRNDGSGNFSQNNLIDFTNYGYPNVLATADLDNNGETDILIEGTVSSGITSQLHSNDGSGNFSQNASISLTDVASVSEVATVDFDNDGDTDILIIGSDSSFDSIIQVYSNDGSGNFSQNTSISLTDVAYYSEVATADFDNDGDTDILTTGVDDSSNPIIQIYSDDGSGNFNQNTSIPLTDVTYLSEIALADFDDDGDTDILIAGEDSLFNSITQIYSNDGSGNFNQNTSISLTDVAYYSEVVTTDLDNDGDTDILVAGEDSSFNPIIQVYSNDGSGNFNQNTSISLTGFNTSIVGTADFDNDGDTDILTTGFDDEFNPIAQVYSNDGSGNFSPNTSISITDIAYNSEVVIADFDDDGDTDILTTGFDDEFNPIAQVYSNDGSGNFSPNTSISITDIGYNSEVVTADFDDDGDTDILITPSNSSFNPISLVYSNDGNGNLVLNSSISLTDVDANVVGTADFDNDGDTDILTTGFDDEFNPIAQVYSNDGSGNFSLENSISFTGVNANVVGTADFDNDGDTDILITGFDDEFNPISQVYSNDGSGNFNPNSSFSFTDVYADVVTEDFDNDGNIDILTTGLDDAFNPIVQVDSNDSLLKPISLVDDNFLNLAEENLSEENPPAEIIGRSGNEHLTGTLEDDTMIGLDGHDTLIGQDGNDSIVGSLGNDSLYGKDGNDTLEGRIGDDHLFGGEGDDEMNGGQGRDRLNGGSGNDTLTGGASIDNFVFATNQEFDSNDLGVDVITDFVVGQDKIILDLVTFTAINDIEVDFATVTGGVATSDAVIVYNTNNGGLFYNPNGSANGFGEGGKFATLSNQALLEADDFITRG